jgi:hypothetical protein
MIRLSDLLFLLMLALAGLLTASWAGDRFGCVGYILGLPLGVVAMFGAVYAFALAWVYVEGLLFDGVPWLPTCRKGRCVGGRLTDFGDYNSVRDGKGGLFGFRCRCGDTYRKVGRRFVEVASDGTLRPYLIWSPVKGWTDDEGPQVGPEHLDPLRDRDLDG